MKHADLLHRPLDPATNGEDAAYVNDTARFLERVLDLALEDSEPGDGGDADIAIGLIALLAGRLEDDALEYTTDLLQHGARRVAARHRDLVG